MRFREEKDWEPELERRVAGIKGGAQMTMGNRSSGSPRPD